MSNIPSFFPLLWLFNKINKTGVTSRTYTAHPSGPPEFTPIFSSVGHFRFLCSVLLAIVCLCVLFLSFDHGSVLPYSI